MVAPATSVETPVTFAFKAVWSDAVAATMAAACIAAWIGFSTVAAALTDDTAIRLEVVPVEAVTVPADAEVETRVADMLTPINSCGITVAAPIKLALIAVCSAEIALSVEALTRFAVKPVCSIAVAATTDVPCIAVWRGFSAIAAPDMLALDCIEACKGVDSNVVPASVDTAKIID